MPQASERWLATPMIRPRLPRRSPGTSGIPYPPDWLALNSYGIGPPAPASAPRQAAKTLNHMGLRKAPPASRERKLGATGYFHGWHERDHPMPAAGGAIRSPCADRRASR